MRVLPFFALIPMMIENYRSENMVQLLYFEQDVTQF